MRFYRPAYTPKDTTNMGSPDRPAPLRERRISSTSGKENQLNKNMGSPLAFNTDSNRLDTNRLETPSKISNRSMDVYNFEASTPTPKKEEEGESCDSGESPHAIAGSSFTRSLTSGVRTSLSFPSQSGARLSSSSNSNAPPPQDEEINLLNTDSIDSQNDSTDTDNGKADLFEKPTALPRGLTSSNRTYGNLSLVPPDSFPNLTKTLYSPGYLKYDTGSSTCSSCIISPLILQSDSQCFTYSVRRYIEHFGIDGPADMEGW